MNENGSQYHHVLNRARWSPLSASRCLLLLILDTLVPLGTPIHIVIDKTLERCWGPMIKKQGNSPDHAHSSRKRSVSSTGLRWIAMGIIFPPS